MLPNNDFCYGEEDFLSEERRETKRHWDRSREAWEEIRSLKGHEELVESSKDGKVIWRVVDNVDVDDLKEIKEREMSSLKEISFVRGGQRRRIELFWSLWPTNIDDDVEKLNEALVSYNRERKEKYQRVMKHVTKSEFYVFIALLIEASVHKVQGSKFWSDGRRDNNKVLFEKVDFSKYMMKWRFHEIKRLVPFIMEDENIKKDGDVWWRFKARVEEFNKIRKQILFTSSIRVFDESMSSYVPR